MRSKEQSFNEVADPGMAVADLAEELHSAFGKPRDQVDKLKAAFRQHGCVVVAELQVMPQDVREQMLAKAGMGAGASGALGVLIGTLDKPFTWRPAAAAPGKDDNEKPKKGGTLEACAEQRSSFRPQMNEYDLPANFDTITLGANVSDMIAREVRATRRDSLSDSLSDRPLYRMSYHSTDRAIRGYLYHPTDRLSDRLSVRTDSD